MNIFNLKRKRNMCISGFECLTEGVKKSFPRMFTIIYYTAILPILAVCAAWLITNAMSHYIIVFNVFEYIFGFIIGISLTIITIKYIIPAIKRGYKNYYRYLHFTSCLPITPEDFTKLNICTEREYLNLLLDIFGPISEIFIPVSVKRQIVEYFLRAEKDYRSAFYLVYNPLDEQTDKIIFRNPFYKINDVIFSISRTEDKDFYMKIRDYMKSKEKNRQQ